MTDARLGGRLSRIAAALPPRSAIVVRPAAMNATGCASDIRVLRRIAMARRLLLLWSGTRRPAGFAGRHGASRRRDDRFFAMPVHHAREAAAARRQRADAVLVSPVHPTRSHPGAPALGRRAAVRLAQASGRPAVMLGGMDAARFAGLRRPGVIGWAAIDAWLRRAR